jgi:serralysin
MTQAQADAITSADVIAFATTSVTARNIGVASSVKLGTDTITLTVGSKSLDFNQGTLSSLSDANNISFNDGSSLLLATTGADTSFTDVSNPSTIYLFGGNDTILGNGEDFIYGGSGADTITGSDTASHLYGQSASGGSDGADLINGGSAGDYIQGNAGNDILNGNLGSDRILGGNGDDTISGGAGNDSVNGNIGNDSIIGDAGDDSLRGGQGNDLIYGDVGNDLLLGDVGTDTLNGGAGIDLISGGTGNDVFAFVGNGTTTDAAPSTPAGTTVEQYDTIVDFTNGQDVFQIRGGSGGATAFGTTASDVLRGSSDAAFSTVAQAKTYAQGLLNDTSLNSSNVDVAAVKVGGDTYLFYASAGTANAAIDSVIKLQGVTDVSLINGGASGDFA